MHKILIFLFTVLLFPTAALAEAPIGIPSGGIWFSKEPFFADEKITISTIVFNSSKNEVKGTLELIDKDVLVDKKEITLSASDNKIVNFPITISEGKHIFSVRIAGGDLIGASGSISIPVSSKTNTYYSSKTDTVQREVLKDTDSDGVSDNEDTDIDGDSLTNTVEKKLGTNPLLADTDGDGIFDSADKNPLKFDKIIVSTSTITEADANKVASSIEKIIPKAVVEPIVSFSTPVVGSVESFRVAQVNSNNNRINGTIDEIIDNVGTARILGVQTAATGTTGILKTGTGKPSPWSVFKSGITNKDDFTKTPFGYLKLFLFLIYQFIISSIWIFYILAIAIIIKLLIFIKKLIFNRGE